MPRTILITGATGGLGLALVEAARARGSAVVATGRSSRRMQRIETAGARFIATDLTSQGADLRTLCRGCESVIHAAALSASWGDPRAFQRINVDVTEALIAAARAEGCRRFVYISSPSIFAAYRDRLDLRGSDEPAHPPLNAYARTKLAGEVLSLAANSPTFATTSVRPRAIVGPDDQVLAPRLIELVKRRWAPLLRGGRALIEMTDVQDAAGAILLAEAKIDAVAGKAINVSGGRPLSVRDIATALARTLDRSPTLVDVPMPLAKVVATAAEQAAVLSRWRTEPRLTRYMLATLAYSQTFDHEETAQLIGFRPRRDPLESLLAFARQAS